jgi:hypothetical protein
MNSGSLRACDRSQTKTGDDRRITLCPRARQVLQRQLRLRDRLAADGRIDHQHVFFKENSEPLLSLQYPGTRWRKTLSALKLRYRRPYMAHHSSVSWNLMIGKNPLWVAKQHGHSIATMLRVYAARTEAAAESDSDAIRRSMSGQARMPMRALRPPKRRRCGCRSVHAREASRTLQSLAVGLPLETAGLGPSVGKERDLSGGERVCSPPKGVVPYRATSYRRRITRAAISSQGSDLPQKPGITHSAGVRGRPL